MAAAFSLLTWLVFSSPPPLQPLPVNEPFPVFYSRLIYGRAAGLERDGEDPRETLAEPRARGAQRSVPFEIDDARS